MKSLLSDPNVFFLKENCEKEEKNFKEFNDRNKKSINSNNNFKNFLEMKNDEIRQSAKNPNLENEEIKMNSLDYLKIFLSENKITFDKFTEPMKKHYKKNNFTEDLFIELKFFEEFLEENNLFSKGEFVDNLPEIFSEESIRIALLTKDNRVNLSFLKQILNEDFLEMNIEIKENNNINEEKESKRSEKESSLGESNYSLSFQKLQKELLEDQMNYLSEKKN